MTTEELRSEYESLRDSLDKRLPKECANCESESDLHIHHIVPLSFGGSNRLSNLVRLCSECHSKAHGGYALIEKATETKRANIIRGKRFSSKILFGYKYEGNRYVIDEDSAEVVRMIFRMRYQAELSTLNVAAILNYLAIPTAGSAKEWKHPVIVRMLNNPQYLGKCVYNGEEMGEDVYPAIIHGELANSIAKFETKYRGRRLPARDPVGYYRNLVAQKVV